MDTIPLFTHLTDTELVDCIDDLARVERHSTATLVAALEELDRRRLYLPAGYSSLFLYCTRRLRLSEGAAYSRIEAARASRRFPAIVPRLADGSITLATVGLLARHLTAANHEALLAEARHKTKREVEQMVARIHPLPDVASSIRKLPAPKRAALSSSSAPAAAVQMVDAGPALLPPPALSSLAVVVPLAPERFKIQITVTRETHDTLRTLQDLMRHAVPSGDAAEIVSRALRLLLGDVRRRRTAAVRRPRAREHPDVEVPSAAPPTRHLAAAVKRAVWDRDAGRCAFVGSDGRCESRQFLEIHHVTPYAAGGRSDATNLELRCRAHNAHEAELFFGTRYPRPPRSQTTPACEAASRRPRQRSVNGGRRAAVNLFGFAPSYSQQKQLYGT